MEIAVLTHIKKRIVECAAPIPMKRSYPMASPSALSLDLSALQRRPVFTSDARVDSHDLVAREFSDHGLKWCSGAVDTALSKVRIRQLQLFMLQYGAEVEIRPRPFDDFVLVHLSLSGVAEMVSDGLPIRPPAGGAALIPPRPALHPPCPPAR